MVAADQDVTVGVLANVAVQSFQWITADGQVANSDSPRAMNKIVGIVRDATPAGKVAQAMKFGEITNMGWSWKGQGAPLYLRGRDLSQTAPISGVLVQLGWVKDRTTILVDVGISVLL